MAFRGEQQRIAGADVAVAPGDCLKGRFVIETELGQGSGGVVFVARDRLLDRPVAIKIMSHAAGADGEALERFALEARTAGALQHPNVLVVHDIGMFQGEPFIVSELLQGATLRERLGGKALPPPEAVDYGLQLAQGLRAAHEKGIVHRDLKPENLFVTVDGRLKISHHRAGRAIQGTCRTGLPRRRWLGAQPPSPG